MPVARAHYRASTAPAPPGAVRWLRFAGTAILAAVGLVCALLLVVRFAVFPQVEAHRDDIAAMLSARLGQTVEIDALAAGWDGWNPRLSIRGLRIRDRAGAAAGALLELPRVDLIVSWTSLPLFDFRLRELVVDGPRLAVRRDARGRIGIAGIAIDPEQPLDDGALTDWLLRQREIVVRDALVTWDDDLRRAPQLVLDRVQFRLERSFGHHRFGLTGVPPADLAAPIDLRGDVSGLTPADWQKVDGRFYLRLDYADVAAWQEWLPLPLPVQSGKGALRLWIDLAQGQPTDVVADLELVDVDTRLSAELPPLALAHVAGRVGWKHAGERRELFTRALQVRAAGGTTLPPTDLDFMHEEGKPGRAAQGRLTFARLELAPLTALAVHLPLPDNLRHDLARYSPQGTLVGGKFTWEGPADAPERFAASGEFDRLGVSAESVFPGATGVSGSFETTEAKGALKLAAHAMTLNLPQVFAEPIPFDSAAGNVRWEKTADEIRVHVSDLAFANAHAAGTAAGSWRSLPAGPGAIDLRAQLTRVGIEHLYRYMPLRTNERVRDWVRRALVKGASNDARLVLTGNLAEFPFPQGRNGQFVVTVKAQGATLDYADHWPPLSDVDADVRFEGTRFAVDATQGRILGAQIGRAHAEIADLHDAHPVLRVNGGDVNGPTSEFLAFIAQTPVADWTGHFTERTEATGNGRLALKFDMPLGSPQDTTVAGEFQFVGNQLRIGNAPALAQVNGRLAFTEKALSGTDIAAEVFGGPLKLQLTGADGRVRINGSGSTNLAHLKGEFDAAISERIAGSADWQVVVNARPDGATWTLESSLKGAVVDLPAPLGKAADQSMPLRVERREATGARRDELLTVDYGSLARLQLRAPNAPGAGYERALLLVGRSVDRGGEADRSGLWVRADVDTINIDDWLAFGSALPARGRGGPRAAALDLEGADIEAASMQAVARKWSDIKVVARRAGDDWRLTLDGREVAGTAVWRAPTPVMPNGRVVARLARLTAPGPGDLVAWKETAGEAPRARPNRNPWPAIDLATDALMTKGRDVGKLEFTARPSGTDWQIESLVLKNAAGTINAEGWWRTATPQETKLDITIEAQEAGAFLAQLGMADAVKAAPTKIQGQLSWAGAPSDFDYPSLAGSFKMTAGAGQFLKADPGVGRLLGVLSLQALPRRITLDFRDVFSEGFAFDSISGAATVQAGIMSTENLRLVGPAANVDISGSVDLSRETQRLRVRVQPALSTSISAGAAVLFIANPLVGVAVGAGALLAQKLLKDPLEQLFSYEYAVSGSWDDPVVQRAGSRTAAAPAQTGTP